MSFDIEKVLGVLITKKTKKESYEEILKTLNERQKISFRASSRCLAKWSNSKRIGSIIV